MNQKKKKKYSGQFWREGSKRKYTSICNSCSAFAIRNGQDSLFHHAIRVYNFSKLTLWWITQWQTNIESMTIDNVNNYMYLTQCSYNGSTWGYNALFIWEVRFFNPPSISNLQNLACTGYFKVLRTFELYTLISGTSSALYPTSRWAKGGPKAEMALMPFLAPQHNNL